jgi:hypothetical protein
MPTLPVGSRGHAQFLSNCGRSSVPEEGARWMPESTTAAFFAQRRNATRSGPVRPAMSLDSRFPLCCASAPAAARVVELCEAGRGRKWERQAAGTRRYTECFEFIGVVRAETGRA